MNTFAEFQILGRVGKIRGTSSGKALNISIAVNYRSKDDRGQNVDTTYWNGVTLFNPRSIAWATENVGPGDLVLARGTMRQDKYEKDGETVYTVTLAATTFSLLAKKQEKDEDSGPE